MKRLVIDDKEVVARGVSADDASNEQRGNANPLFPPAFFAFLERGGRALMVFSQHDRLYSEYEEKFAEPLAVRLRPLQYLVEKHVIPDANHVLSSSESRRKMIDVVESWLVRWHPAAPQ